MKRFSLSILLFFLLSFPALVHSQDKSIPCPTVTVYFSPNGGCSQAIVNQLDKARTSILMQAYSFTSAPIAKALLNAHKRGVTVQVILDKSQLKEKYLSLTFLYNQGIPTRIDAAYAIAHNKIMIVDRETVITGSFNFTTAAEEKNAENLLVIRDKILAAKYVQNWKEHAEHSQVYLGRGK
jgi:phosphatidylserine/phosphatidylglycerophosphate/cardiolipin synthase-like enzyme